MKAFKTIDDIKKVYGDVEINEGADVWIVSRRGAVFFLPKPLQKERIMISMRTNGFPEKYLKIALNGVQETEAIRKIRVVKKKGVILDGKPGVGKSIACTWKIAKLLQYREVLSELCGM